MKKILFLLSFVFVALSTQAQDTDNWFTDFEAAKTYAKANNTKILMVFSGSDWCRPCIKFKKDILKNEAFENYAKGKLAILYLDFPARRKNRLPKEQKKKNEALAEKYNKSGAFPLVLLMDAEAKSTKTLKFANQTAQEFLAEYFGK